MLRCVHLGCGIPPDFRCAHLPGSGFTCLSISSALYLPFHHLPAPSSLRRSPACLFTTFLLPGYTANTVWLPFYTALNTAVFAQITRRLRSSWVSAAWILRLLLPPGRAGYTAFYHRYLPAVPDFS